MTLLDLPEASDRITPDWFDAAYRDVRSGLDAAEAADAPDAWLDLFTRWNRIKALAEGEYARRHYHYTKDVRNEDAAAAETLFRESITPVVEEHNAALMEALLASRHRAAIAERFGDQLIAVLEVGRGPLAPVNSELRVEASKLSHRYDELVASAEVDVQGEALTLAQARGKLSSEDAATRRAAYGAYYGWFLGAHDEIADIYGQLARLRDTMGKNVGHPNFVPLGYDGMGRTDYGPDEVRAFRDAVETYISPLFAAKCAAQAKALGTETLRPWDNAYDPAMNLPDGVAGPVEAQLDKMARALERLSPKLAAHFERMRNEDLIDLENRKGKGAGAYCTSFPDESKVAIFCNSTGSEDDVRTLTHELGHAFQGWESQWIDAVDLRWPTSDACEVHSMGFEFLALPYLDEFFDEEHRATFARARWSRAIDILCYVCVVDAFQHWVYENPEATADERDAAWVRLDAQYRPGIDWSGEAQDYVSTRWYAQLHLFRYPFYYIDYALAETGAMQLGMLDAKDHADCMERYMELCRLGGTKSVTALFEGAGLRSPFEAETIRDLAQHAAEQLGL